MFQKEASAYYQRSTFQELDASSQQTVCSSLLISMFQ